MLPASIDPGFSAIIAALLSGGIIAAWSAYRRTPVEIEAMSVTTLRGVIEELRVELDRKDEQLAEQNRVIGEQNARIQALIERVDRLESGKID